MFIKREIFHHALAPLPSAFLSYEGLINLGSTITPYPVLFDTGSCQFWVRKYDGRSSSTFISNNLQAPKINYSDGTIVDGFYVSDSAKLGNLSISRMQFISAQTVTPSTSALKGVVGLCHNPMGTVSFMEEATRSGLLTEKMFAFSIASDTQSAQVSFGGIDKTKYTGAISWVSVSPTTSLWQAPMTGLVISTVDWTGTIQAVFDTGSSLLTLPPDLSNKVNSLFNFTRLPGSSVYGGPCPTQYPPSFKLMFKNIALNIKPETLVYAEKDICYSTIADGKTADSATIGNSVLREYYTVFNYVNHTIGFASSINKGNGTPTSIPPLNDNGNNNINNETSPSVKNILTGVFISLLGLCLVGMAIFAYKRKKEKRTLPATFMPHSLRPESRGSDESEVPVQFYPENVYSNVPIHSNLDRWSWRTADQQQPQDQTQEQRY